MSAWLVTVETERMGGGAPLREIYVVNESDPVKALEIVATDTEMTDEQAHAWASISDDFCVLFKVPKGQCRRVQAVS